MPNNININQIIKLSCKFYTCKQIQELITFLSDNDSMLGLIDLLNSFIYLNGIFTEYHVNIINEPITDNLIELFKYILKYVIDNMCTYNFYLKYIFGFASYSERYIYKIIINDNTNFINYFINMPLLK